MASFYMAGVSHILHARDQLQEGALQFIGADFFLGEVLRLPEIRFLGATHIVEGREEHQEAQVGLAVALLGSAWGLLGVLVDGYLLGPG